MADNTPIMQRAMPYLTVAVWSFAELFGGATRVGMDNDLLVQLVSAPLLVLALFCLFGERRYAGARPYVLSIALVVILICLQLVPLPPEIWTRLGSREVAEIVYTTAGIPLPWLPVSLVPGLTKFALASLIAPVAIFCGTLVMARDGKLFLIIVPVAVATLHVFVGVGQFNNAANEYWSSTIALYVPGEAYGYFANRNHYAASNYAMIPLAFGWLLALRSEPRRFGILWAIAGAAAIALFLIGLSIAYSRAGAAIGAATIGMCAALYFKTRDRAEVPRGVSIAILAAIIVVSLVFIVGIASLVGERGVAYSIRGVFVEKTLGLIAGAPIFGYGLGSFVPLYMTTELPTEINRYFANHAHNDWLEIVLDTGLFGAVALLVFTCWIAFRTMRMWIFDRPSGALGTFALAASITVVGLLAHSVLDYPLRTTALASTFAACCAMIAAVAAGWDRQRTAERPMKVDAPAGDERRHRSRSRRQPAGT
ncbi:O-antigen ligase family protein [Kaistia geumhonensis]|uniref:O-antigen ligase n=1 Tax=Kaistia geumhonensis TaxID=410839 RepID=A0ABU0M158_9HYPH|nr:O-antigen ligase family protein [Kaistia geumhonensis]MCX5480082.1 O-antigen ligase family protein [Kaistia geumhonensis]MDQ0514690.1 O-antigen ligase [Kaistia geumhonensis]